ncbi:MAG: hypothetical protein FJ039_06340 [Chloroflexi bacterium]|nr:hypothetical protein [Chloroflexota bacterium]
MTRLILVDPRAEPSAPPAALAKRPLALDGKRIGLLDNHKLNAGALLEEIARLMAERYEVTEVVRAQKSDGSTPAPPPLLDDLARRCDLVIAAVGD